MSKNQRFARRDSVRRYLENELSLYRFWCVAGPGGRGWHTWAASPADRPSYEAIRDWLESALGESPETDPWRS